MKKTFLPLLFAAIGLGIFFPVGQSLEPSLPYLLATLLFFNFYIIQINIKQFFQREVIYYILVVLVIAPFLVWISTKNLSPSFRLGIFLTTITPTAISSPVVIRILEGNMGLSIANTMLYNLLAPFSYSLLLRFYFASADLRIPVKNIIIKLLLLVCVPCMLATIFKKIDRLTRPLKAISAYVQLLFVIMVFVAVSSSSKQLQTVPYRELLLVLIYIIVIAAALYLLGFLLGKDLASKKALAVGMGQKNNGLCIWLALSHFDPLSAIPSTVYIIIHHIINSLLIFIFRRK